MFTGGIIASFVQSILYGLYCATFVHCIRWLIFDDDGWKFREKMNWFMILMTTLIFVLSTANLGTSVPLVFESILPSASDFTPRFFMFNLINIVFERTTFLITDGILVYRCWIIYGKSWRAISLPLLLITAYVVCVIFYIYWAAMWLRDPHRVFATFQVVATTAALSIAINVYATSAIVWRVLQVAKGSTNKPTRLHNACRTLVESGGLFTATSILNLISDFRGTSIQVNVVADAINFSMAGIAFNLILIRVYAQRANGLDSQADSKQANTKPMSALQFQAPDGSVLTGTSSTSGAAQNAHTATDIVEEVRGR